MNERINDVDGIVSQRIGMVMSKAGCTPHDRAVVEPALAVEARTGEPGAAIQLADGTLITGKTSALLGCSAAMLLNALKHLAGLDRKSTRMNSSHMAISYAVFCLRLKKG